ncbi:MAPEG family protein [uncultured Bartonella sp.]|uniref:MAPEG family protein n=1 Tax=uncultured Bartonella sp. TaxID=104108 RepID=UPI00260FE2B2|nr:MAPEG family protein [uncultured Bartonella sp.]
MNAPAALLTLSVILLLVHIFLQAFFATRELGSRWNAGARDGGEVPKSLFAGRAGRASANFRETYPAFLALMLLSEFQPVNVMITVAGGTLWLVARVLYIPLYLFGVRYIRSIVWLISIVGLGIMLAAAFWR